MLQLPLVGQGKKDFMWFKTATEDLLDSDSTASIASPRRIVEDSFMMPLDDLKNQVLKDFVTINQVYYLQQNQRKFMGVSVYVQGGSKKSVTIQWSTIQKDQKCQWYVIHLNWF